MIKVFAIDLGATSAKCAFFIDGKVVANFNYDTTKRKDLLENIAKKANEVAEENNIKMNELDFVGIAVCGIVDNLKGSVVYSANLGWKDYPTREELKRIFKNDNIVVLNDAKSATYGEWSKGLDEKPDSMALFTIGTGVGGGAIFNRKLVFGDNTGLPSEPGHGGGFQDEVQCICGLKGCIEPVSSATGIERKLIEVAKSSNGKLAKVYSELKENMHIKDIAFLVEENDPEVMQVFNECLEPLAKCISVLIHFFDISMIVIGGGPSNLGDPLIQIIRNKLKDYVLPDFYNRLNLKKAVLGDLVGAWGIYQYGISHILKNK